MSVLLLVVIYIAFVGLGLPDSLLGSAWPVAHADLGVSVGVAGIVSIVTMGGTVLSSLLSERLIRRFGPGVVTTASVCLTAAALMGMGFTKSFAVVLLLALPLGFGGGSVDAALNNFVALHYQAKHMNWMHCCWGIGATAGPMVMSLFLVQRFWHGAYQTVSAALFAVVLVLIASLPLWKRVGTVTAQNMRKEIVPRRVLIKKPGAIFACLAFFTYCGAEFVTGLWASTYFVNVEGIAPAVAASWTSLYYLGITFGRLLSGFAAIKLSNKMLVRIGQGMILLGMLLLFLLPNGTQFIGLLLTGLGCAPLFPSLLDETPKLFGAELSQGMMGLQLASAYIGSTLIPPLFGLVSPLTGLSAWPWYLLALYGLLIFSTERTQRDAAIICNESPAHHIA